MNALATSFRELEVYKAAFAFQQELFKATKTWPAAERFALTDQVRRSARSVGANIAEAWAKRRYAAHFLSKLTDSDGELQETVHWLDTAYSCGYITEAQHSSFGQATASIGKMLGAMMKRHESFCR